jgi:protein-disulfide isomerase
MRPDASRKIATVTPKRGPNVVLIGAIIAAAVVIAVVVAIVIGNNGASGSGTAQSVPAGVVGGTGGGILVDPAAKDKAGVPALDVYVDFQCPNCGRFEQQFGPALTELAKTGAVRYVVHMMSFLDAPLRNDSSKRATNAASCAADAGKFGEYHTAVFAAQPAEEGDGYTDAQLTELAKTAGISGPALTTWQQCTTEGRHDQYVADVAEASGRAGVTGTPTVMLNGKDISKSLFVNGAYESPEALVATIKAAKS